MREKLIKVLDVIESCNAKYCCDCEFAEDVEGCVRRKKEIIADHLIASGVTIQKWIPVTERLPELETYTYSVDVLFSDYEEGIHVGYVCLETGTWKDKYSRHLYAEHKVTHWMPLPSPPKGE